MNSVDSVWASVRIVSDWTILGLILLETTSLSSISRLEVSFGWIRITEEIAKTPNTIRIVSRYLGTFSYTSFGYILVSLLGFIWSGLMMKFITKLIIAALKPYPVTIIPATAPLLSGK